MPKNLIGIARDLVKLDTKVRTYHAASVRPSTWVNYKHAWQLFLNFVAPKDAWRADANDIARWCVLQALQGFSTSTINNRLCGLKFHYEQLGKGYFQGRSGVATRKSPTGEDIVRRVLRGIARQHGRPPLRKAPLMLDSVEKMLDLQPDNLVGLRNKALLCLTWAACRRISEIYSLNVDRTGDGWIEFDDNGLVVVLRRSKANQEYRLEERYGVPARRSAPRYCPVALVREWIARAGIKRGPVFPSVYKNGKSRGRRLYGDALGAILESSARSIGLDPRTVSPHSLRVGCITWLYLEGVHPDRIREQSGHKDLQTLLTYIRPLKRSATSPLAETRWVK